MAADIQKALVTGGAGFIGSHIVDELLRRGAEVIVYDNFSTGQELFLEKAKQSSQLKIVKADVGDLQALQEAMVGVDFVFHLQANADVRGGIENRRLDLEQNTIATWNVLEAMVQNEVKRIAFASSATVYGEPDVYPTPENYAPLQTSLYGASKYNGEAMIQAYGEYFDITSWIYRFVSWTGPRYSHGVVFDFYHKLLKNPEELFILGNGKQQKSYLDVEDGVRGIFHAIDSVSSGKNIYNLGHEDFINVLEVADIICAEMGLEEVSYKIEDPNKERGWLGDSPMVHLDTAKLQGLGWAVQIPIADSLQRTIKYLIENDAEIKRSERS